MRTLGIVFFLIGIACAYLSYIDRMSPLALDLVEQQQRLGLPFASIGGLGILLVVGSFWGNRSAPPEGPAPRPRAAPLKLGADWKAEVHQRAAALQLEPGEHILHEQGGVPLCLVLTRMPPGGFAGPLMAFVHS
jgi:hypothetical protein